MENKKDMTLRLILYSVMLFSVVEIILFIVGYNQGILTSLSSLFPAVLLFINSITFEVFRRLRTKNIKVDEERILSNKFLIFLFQICALFCLFSLIRFTDLDYLFRQINYFILSLFFAYNCNLNRQFLNQRKEIGENE